MPDDNRRLRQQLESLSRAGLKFLPRRQPQEASAQQATVAEPAPVRPTEAASGSRTAKATAPPSQKSAAPEKTLFVPAAGDSRAANQGLQNTRSPGSIATLLERQQALAMLNEKVKACTRCGELSKTRTQTVFGVGNPQARILFIGEAPGADEDAQGEPFVGRAGKLLNDIIAACKLKREDVYICRRLHLQRPEMPSAGEPHAG